MSEIKQLPEGKLRIVIDDFAGYNAKQSPYTKLGINEFPVMDNYYMNKGNEMLIKRDGMSKFVTNLVDSTKPIVSIAEHITTDSHDYIVAKSNNGSSSKLMIADIQGVSPTGISWNQISNTETAGKYNFLSYKDRLYIANRNSGTSTNKVWYYDGGYTAGYLDMGCPPCDMTNVSITRNAAGTGSLSAGTYYYAVTYIYDGYMESGCLIRSVQGGSNFFPYITGVLATESVSLGVREGNARVTGYKIYRSKVNDSTAYYYHTTVIDPLIVASAFTFLDTKADTELTQQMDPSLLTADLKKPFKSKYHCVHKSSLVQGNLADDIYSPFAVGDITLSSGGGGGSLSGNTLYNYRFYKCWVINNGGSSPKLWLSPFLQVTRTTAVGEHTININVQASALSSWHGLIVAQRSSLAGTNDYKWINIESNAWTWGRILTAGTYADDSSDASRNSDIADYTIAPDVVPYSSYVAISDTGKPDIFSNLTVETNGALVPNSNVFQLGQGDGQNITGVYSEYNRIVIFKENSIYAINTSAQGKAFWVSNVVVRNVGATDGLIIQINKNEYIFARVITEYSGASTVKIYYWDGQTEPILISTEIETLLTNTNTLTIYDMVYNAYQGWVYITLYNTANTRTYVLIYDISMKGKWYVWYNTVADMDTRGLCNLNSYGVVIGTGEGGISNFKSSIWKDNISGTNRDIYTYLQSKTFNFEDMDFDLEAFRILIEVGTGGDSSLGYLHLFGKKNNASETDDSLPTITANTSGKVKLRLKGNCRQYYFRLVAVADVPYKILAMSLDIIPRHTESGGF